MSLSNRREANVATMLPSLLTTGNLLCGFSSLVLSAQGRFEAAALLILLGIVFDSLDGQVARWLGIATDFGVEYDSLADVITFGVAPALLWTRLVLLPLGRLGWVSGFLFVVGAAVRLARFNIQANEGQPMPYFQGLPSPGAAGTVAGISLLTASHVTALQIGHRTTALALLPLLGVLMVSTIPYAHFKQQRLNPRRLSWILLGAAGLLAVIVAEPRWALPLLFSGYVLSGPLLWLRLRFTPQDAIKKDKG